MDPINQGVLFMAPTWAPNCSGKGASTYWEYIHRWDFLSWLITMVNKLPKDRVVGPPSKWPLHGFQTGVTNHLLTGMILQVPSLKLTWPLKIHGWKIHFLLGKLIWRGELLVSGSVGISGSGHFRRGLASVRAAKWNQKTHRQRKRQKRFVANAFRATNKAVC